MKKRYLAFADRLLVIEYPSAVDEILHFLFRNVPPGTRRQPDHVLILGQNPDFSWTLKKDGEEIGSAPDTMAIANLLMGEVIYAMIDGVHSGLTLHAAAVALGSKGIWLPGTSGAGKSSLAAWLTSRGFTYLTDELVHCPFDSLSFEAFTRPFNFKQHGLDALALLMPGEHARHKLAGKAVTMIQPDIFDNKEPESSPVLSLLLFPGFQQQGELAIEPISPAKAGLLLMGCHVNARNLAGHGFADVVKLCRKVPACRLTYSSFDQLEGCLDNFLEIALRVDLNTDHFSRLCRLAARPHSLHKRDTVRQDTKKIPISTPKGEKKKLTIGMATFDDYDGVYFSAQAIRLYHPEVTDDTEILVIDNNPGGNAAPHLKNLEKIPNFRYVPCGEKTGTAVRDKIFEEANSDAVLCIDSHVLIAPGAIFRLIKYFNDHPDCNDLLQGPLLHDDLSTKSTHFKPEWNRGMYGVWGYDKRGSENNGQAFDIPMQGLGLFACSKNGWPGFHPGFKGFGGEEGYIHEKFRQRGDRTLCLPFMLWLHRFERPGGVPYTVNWEDRIRNYMLGFQELGLDTQPVIDHFNDHLGEQATTNILHRLNLDYGKKK